MKNNRIKNFISKVKIFDDEVEYLLENISLETFKNYENYEEQFHNISKGDREYRKYISFINNQNFAKDYESTIVMIELILKTISLTSPNFITKLLEIGFSSEKGRNMIITWIETLENYCNFQDEEGNTILHIFTKKNDISRAMKLLEYFGNIDPYIKNHNGDTPIDIAKKYNFKEIIQLLKNK